ncbi:MAG: lactonase family protein [Flavobacterium sp.]
MKKQLLAIAIILTTIVQAQKKEINLLIGTYTKTCDSKGIYVYSFDTETAEATLKSNTENVVNPSFLTVSPDHKFVYAVNEDGDQSKVSAFSYDGQSGKLVLLNSQSSAGNDPCHIINDDKNVIVSNYSGGSLVVLQKSEDGSLKGEKTVNEFSGSSINKQRQEKSHIHQAVFSPDKKYVLIADLGTDLIYAYKYHPEKDEKLEAYKVTEVAPGSGPRHLVFSTDGKHVYCIHELDGSVSVYDFNKGKLSLSYRRFMTLNDASKEENSAAEIAISPDGNYLYTTNRGTFNDITCNKIRKNGRLEYVERIPTLGKGPRSFAIDPTGKFLLVAHQYTNNIVIFSINKETGKLTDTGKRIELCSPVCLVFE